jgi:non-canonical (house-cleaning) NTP pyrophosphatase
MGTDLKNFWQRLQAGVEVAVAGHAPDKLLGVRDGFLRFFHDGMDRTVSVAVVPQAVEEDATGLLVSDEEVVREARRKVVEMEDKLHDTYHFYISSEGGVESLEVDGRQRYLIRNWTVVRSPLGEAWGSSGAIQLPDRIVEGWDNAQSPYAMPGPGTRRSGGITSSLTGGLENRRKNVALSTFHALSTLFYGILESRPIR